MQYSIHYLKLNKRLEELKVNKISQRRYNKISLLILAILLIIQGVELITHKFLVQFTWTLDLFQVLFWVVILIDIGVLISLTCIKKEEDDEMGE